MTRYAPLLSVVSDSRVHYGRFSGLKEAEAMALKWACERKEEVRIYEGFDYITDETPLTLVIPP